jgi:hypothetical protein
LCVLTLAPAYPSPRFDTDIRRWPHAPDVAIAGARPENEHDSYQHQCTSSGARLERKYNLKAFERIREFRKTRNLMAHFAIKRFPTAFVFCGEQDVVRWDSAYGQIEHQANVFAANILMPLDDFRRQIAATAKVDLDMISHCADRYRVSLIAATLRWLGYTQRRAVLVVSRDGFILWARSSTAALKTGAFFRTSAGPIEIPTASLPAKQDLLIDGRASIDHGLGIWFREPVREMTVFAEHYDFAISLLLLGDAPPYVPFETESEPDVYDRMVPQERRREW